MRFEGFLGSLQTRHLGSQKSSASVRFGGRGVGIRGLGLRVIGFWDVLRLKVRVEVRI